MNTNAVNTEVAILGGGCFWCLHAVFMEMRGILQAESGYMGGNDPQPTYDAVCTGTTGHAEVVRLTFDPTVTSYRDILEVFFTIHDPTTLNRQGNDVGTQYRSVIFYGNTAQQDMAHHVMAAMASVWDAPLVTELAPAATWHKAEAAQQDYFVKHPFEGYCAFVVAPKITKFRETFPAKTK